MRRPLVIAILAKSKAHILPLYLKSLMAQTEVGSDTIFYIRTNDNKDETSEILRDWYQKWNWKWRTVIDDSSIDESLKEQENHNWSYNRFKILGDIRQKSIQFAINEGADYFIADADNICIPNTIKALRATNLQVVSPLLHPADPCSMYSNFHSSIDENGYLKPDDIYNSLMYQQIKGLIEVPVVHCTYFIKNEALPYVKYDDESGRYEYVIFSDSLRKSNIPQYLDTRKIYGKISFATTAQELERDYEHTEFRELDEYITKSLYKNGI